MILDQVQDNPTMAPPSLLPTTLRNLDSSNSPGIFRNRKDVATGFFGGVSGCFLSSSSDGHNSLLLKLAYTTIFLITGASRDNADMIPAPDLDPLS